MPRNDQSNPRQTLEELDEILPSRGRVYIIPHNYPDPDALASAAGIYLLLAKRFRLQGHIMFSGTVSRAENQELLRQFRYPWSLLHQESRPSQDFPAILVDTSPWSGNVTVPDFAIPVAVFDHHPESRKRGKPQGMAMDIRTGAGATCTIVYEYLETCKIAIPKWLTTIMAYAIASETLDLSRDSTDHDLAAYMSLLSKANLSALGRIRHAPLPRAYYGTLQEAIKNASVFGRLAWTHLAHIEQKEVVAEIADLLLRMERITWAFCTAYQNGGLLISIRSSDPHARCGRLLRETVGKSGSAGGHHHMAAGILDLTHLSDQDRDSKREVFVQELALRIERRSARQRKNCLQQICPQPLVEPKQ